MRTFLFILNLSISLSNPLHLEKIILVSTKSEQTSNFRLIVIIKKINDGHATPIMHMPGRRAE